MTTAWLRDLEEKVQEASTQLGGLRARNEELQARVAELEQQLESAPDPERLAELEQKLEAAPDPDQVAGWTEEREDIRQRVEKLVEHLDQLLVD